MANYLPHSRPNPKGFGIAKGEKRQATAGRRKGVPNVINASVKEMILNALKECGGVAYLREQAWAHPAAFLALLGKVLPMQIVGEGGGPIVIQISGDDADL